MSAYVVAVGLILALLLAGIGVDRLYRRFARRHPELGPFRGEGGCGTCSSCDRKGAGHCPPDQASLS
jgi:hypothetical protein